jgi:hypothetical protein
MQLEKVKKHGRILSRPNGLNRITLDVQGAKASTSIVVV